MGVVPPGSTPACTAGEPTRAARRRRYLAPAAALAAVLVFAAGWEQPSAALLAGAPSAAEPASQLYQGSTSAAARASALRSIPTDKLDEAAKAKVNAVLANVTLFRRMPVLVIPCDPDLYLFLVRHPDVVVNIWEVLKLSQLKVRELGANTYRMAESAGTVGTVEFLYSSHDTHVVYADGYYEGPLLARPVHGRSLLVLKTGYVCETNGRCYVTTRLDAFVNVEPGGAELLTKAIHLLMGNVADSNFVQSVAFLGSLSRTAEIDSAAVQRLATRLVHVRPEVRRQLAELVQQVARKSASTSSVESSDSTQVANRMDTEPAR